MDAKNAIAQAIKAVEQDNSALAQTILKKLIQQDPGNTAAWSLLSDLVENPEHARQCLERVIFLDPGNKGARERLARLDDPFADITAFTQGGRDLFTEAPVEIDAEPFPQFDSEPEIYFEVEDSAEDTISPTPSVETGEPSEPPEEEPIKKPRQAVKGPVQPKKRRTKPKKRSSRWLEISLAVLAVVCLCIIAIVVISQNPSLLQTAPAPTPESPFDVIIRNRDTANAEDLDGYMDTIHPRASGRTFTRMAMQDLFDKYDLRYDVYGLKVIEQTEKEVQVSFTLDTRKIKGPAFTNNRVTGVMILRLDKGSWKIYDQEVADITYFD